MEPSYPQIIGAYVRSVAEWRKRRTREEPHEPRHRQSARQLDDLAGFIESLPPDDARLTTIGRATVEGEMVVPGPLLANAVARIGFYSTEASLDGLVSFIQEIALQDLEQRGHDPLRDLPF